MIAVAITALDEGAVFVRDALHCTVFGLDVETAGFAYRDTPRMGTGLLTGGYYRTHHVAGLKAVHLLLPHQKAAWEAVLCQSRALIAATPHRLDRQCRHCPVMQLLESTHAGGIQGMRFGDVEALPVVFGTTTAGYCHRQAGGVERGEQRPARGIDRTGIAQRLLKLALHTFKPSVSGVAVGFQALFQAFVSSEKIHQ